MLKEIAPPSTLLGDPESMFSKLVDKTGPEVSTRTGSLIGLGSESSPSQSGAEASNGAIISDPFPLLPSALSSAGCRCIASHGHQLLRHPRGFRPHAAVEQPCNL